MRTLVTCCLYPYASRGREYAELSWTVAGRETARARDALAPKVQALGAKAYVLADRAKVSTVEATTRAWERSCGSRCVADALVTSRDVVSDKLGGNRRAADALVAGAVAFLAVLACFLALALFKLSLRLSLAAALASVRSALAFLGFLFFNAAPTSLNTALALALFLILLPFRLLLLPVTAPYRLLKAKLSDAPPTQAPPGTKHRHKRHHRAHHHH